MKKTHTIKTINGDYYEISQAEYDWVEKVLLLKKDERPNFVKLRESGSIIATASITAVAEKKKFGGGF